MGFQGQVAQQQSRTADVRFGSILLQKSAIMSAWADAKGFAAIGY
jgi:hypothetical protein